MLFGHQNDDATQPTPDPVAVAAPTVNPLAVDPDTGVSLPVATEIASPEPSALNQPATPPVPPLPTPPSPTVDSTVVSPEPAAAPELPPVPSPTEPIMPLDDSTIVSSDPITGTDPVISPVADDLIELKQQALAQLSPLVDQLDQTPEEEFRTTMMMIQSTDNQMLIKKAYEAAQKIVDEKTRAQALLDVINEINYFTQPKPEA
ncbi:MAG TPA: hypothetical protein VLF69_05715 [Candidatus Saccharimonadales bacterium]|nr:hypothetical protein [Candidatus Saccharimonadales bacterium]